MRELKVIIGQTTEDISLHINQTVVQFIKPTTPIPPKTIKINSFKPHANKNHNNKKR